MKATNVVLQAAVAAGQLDEYMTRNILLRSERGLPLVATNTLPEGGQPTVTVECYVKWYALYVVKRVNDEFIVVKYPFPDDTWCLDSEAPFMDHVPNPRVVARWADHFGFVVDEVAMDLMVGRWEREALSHYDNMGDAEG